MEHADKHRAIVVVSILGVLLLLGPVGLCAGAGQAAQREVFRRSGTLEAVDGQAVRSTVPESLEVLFVVPPGERVEKGDLLIELDVTHLREALSRQQVDVEKAELKVQLAETALGAATEEGNAAIELAEQGLEVAKLELEAYLAGEYPAHKSEARNILQMARQRLTLRREQLAARKDSEDVTEAELAVHEAESALQGAENRLHLIELLHPLQKAQREMAISERKFGLMRMRNDCKRTVLERQGDLTFARDGYARLRERLDLLHKWVGDCKLYAPRDGLVLHGGPDQRARRGNRPILQPGRPVRSGTTLIEVVDPHRFTIEMTVARQTAKRIESGNEAVVRVDAMPEARFEGRVTEVRPGAGRGDDSVVTVQFDDPQGHLRIGMSAQVEIAL